jgi:hypothetical protein
MYICDMENKIKELNKKQKSVIFEFFYFGKLHNSKIWDVEKIKNYIEILDMSLTKNEVFECCLEIIERIPLEGFKLKHKVTFYESGKKSDKRI